MNPVFTVRIEFACLVVVNGITLFSTNPNITVPILKDVVDAVIG